MLRRGLLDLVVEPGVNEFTKETPYETRGKLRNR